MRFFALAVCTCGALFNYLIATALATEMIIGPAEVVDGDTIMIRDREIDLYGVDAPEKEQLCRSPTGDTWSCGELAASALARKVGTQKVECLVKENTISATVSAKCYQKDGNLSHWLLKEGWAVASLEDGTNYIPGITEARSQNKNIWSGEFIFPDDWRAGKRLILVDTGDLEDGQPDETVRSGETAQQQAQQQEQQDAGQEEEEFQAGVLGLSRALWQLDHGAPDGPSRTCPASVYTCYEGNRYRIIFLQDIIRLLETHWDGGGIPIQESRAAVSELIPADSRLVRTYRSRRGDVVDLYNSDYLKSKYTGEYLSTNNLVPDQLWVRGHPGDFIVVHAGGNLVDKTVLSFGNSP